jgi:hypothetical protein
VIVTVKLTSAELMLGGNVGVMRRVASIQNGNNPNWHAKDSSWATDIDGALGEMAVAKHLGVYWEPSVNTFKAADLCGFIQIKSTNHSSGHLIVRDNDARHHLYVLVITAIPHCRLIGSIWGEDARQIGIQRNLDADAPCWWVSQEQLSDLPDRSQLQQLKAISDNRRTG